MIRLLFVLFLLSTAISCSDKLLVEKEQELELIMSQQSDRIMSDRDLAYARTIRYVKFDRVYERYDFGLSQREAELYGVNYDLYREMQNAIRKANEIVKSTLKGAP